MLKRNRLTRRRALQLGLQAAIGLGAAVTADTAVAVRSGPRSARRQFIQAVSAMSEVPLRQQAAAKGIIYGAAVRRVDLEQDGSLAASVVQECGLLVPEWELKWAAGLSNLRPTANTYDFDDADWIVNFARGHNKRLHGTALAWHLSLPEWFDEVNSPQVAQQLLINHIQTVMGRYVGQIYSWDVANEVINPADGREDSLRDSPWLRLLGPAYIGLAFRIAAQTDPAALLVLNEYDIEYDMPEQDLKRAAVLQLIKLLQSQGVPIGALGIQSHLDAAETRFNPQKFRKFLADVASLGLKILITELDVGDQLLPPDVPLRDLRVAQVYTEYLAVVLREPAVISVTTWGISDPYSWLNDIAPRDDGVAIRPLLLDGQMRRKSAWSALANAFDQLPMA